MQAVALLSLVASAVPAQAKSAHTSQSASAPTAVAWANQTEGVDWSCADETDCESCYNYSSLCHWCKNGCHARSDVVHGCTYGENCWKCSDTKDCTACYNTSSWCHWCGESGCHQRGHLSNGCTVGVTCDEPPGNKSCVEQRSCKGCYDQVSCHWCPDSMECHPWGSAYGCVMGATCYARDSCERDEAEWVGYAPAQPGLIVLLLLVLVFSLCCCCCCLTTCHHSRESIRRVQVREALDLTSEQNNISFMDMRAGNNIEMAAALTEPVDDRSGSFTMRLGMRLRRWYWRVIEKCIWRCYCFSWLCWVAFIVFLTTLGVLAVIYSPHQPLTTICYDGLDWSAIVKNINVFYGSRYYADYELLLSLYNPNRVDLNVSSMRGVVHFPVDAKDQREVGTVTLGNFFAKAGSITDTIGMLSLSMDRWNALGLGSAYEAGHLYIAVDLSLGFEVSAGKLPFSWSSSMQMDRQVIAVNDPMDYTYCKCKGP